MFIVDDSSSFWAQNNLILSFSSSFNLQTQRFENYAWSNVSSLILYPGSSRRSNINGLRKTRGNDAILHEYYYIKVSNTIEKKKKERKLREKKNEKKKNEEKNEKPVANRTFTLAIQSALLQKRTIDQEKSWSLFSGNHNLRNGERNRWYKTNRFLKFWWKCSRLRSTDKCR